MSTLSSLRFLNQEKLADELLAALAEGKEPLDKLVVRVSLAHTRGNASEGAYAA